MANAVIQINNETSGFLSLDVEFGKGSGRVIRTRLAPRSTPIVAGQPSPSVDVGDIVSLSELNAHPQIQSLLTSSPPKISIVVARGTTDVQGSDVTTVADAGGTGEVIRQAFTFAVGAAGARDVTLYNANFPFAGRLVDAQIMVSTAFATTLTLRDATGGGGNALSQAMSTAAAGRVRDNGTGQTAGDGVLPALAKGSSLIARLGDGQVAGTVIVDFVRLS